MSAILDALGWVGDSLDKPGRAVRGLLGGRPEEGLAAIPFSDTMGLTSQQNRVSGSDLLRQLGMDAGDDLGGTLAGMGVEMATDPLMYAGGALGGVLGRRAGAAAMARGPRYNTTADDLMRQVPDLADDWAREATTRHIDELGRVDPRVFSEIPDGSRLLGAGAEGFAVSSPDGMVHRLGLMPQGAPGRPVADTLLQATRTTDYGGGKLAARAERLPFADSVGSKTYWDSPARPGQQDRISQLMDDSQANGLWFADVKPANAGRYNGRDLVIDPGAVDLDGFAGAFGPVVRPQTPGPLMGRLLDLLGSDGVIRAGLAPAYTGRLVATGAGSGATLGGFGRLNQE